MAFPIVPVLMAVSTALTAYGAYQTYEAGKAAEEAANQQARMQEIQNEEAVRRLEKQQAETEATAKARAAAAGFESSSFDPSLEAMEEEHTREADYQRWAGKATAQATRTEGSLLRRQATAQSWGMLGSAAGSAAGYDWASGWGQVKGAFG